MPCKPLSYRCSIGIITLFDIWIYSGFGFALQDLGTTIFVDDVEDFGGGKRIVPVLKGLTKKEIIEKIKGAGLIPRVKKVKASSSEQSGKVSNINPLPGTEVIAGSIIYVDLFEDFGGGKSIEKEAKCENYNKCLSEMMQEIQQLSLKMASSQALTFGCKYLGLGQAMVKVSKDANSVGCKVAGNHEQAGDMIKETAGQMCRGQAIAFDINKLSSCKQLGKKTSSSIVSGADKNTGSISGSSSQPPRFNKCSCKDKRGRPYWVILGMGCGADEDYRNYDCY